MSWKNLILMALLSQPLFGFPEIHQGTLDLTNTKIDHDTVWQLRGEMEFYFEKLLTPQDFQKNFNHQTLKKTMSKAHGSWADKNIIADGKKKSHSYATYRFKIRTGIQHPQIAIWLGSISTSFRLFLNGNLLTEGGKVAKVRQEHIANFYRPIVFLPMTQSEHEIILQVSNFKMIRGGIWDPLIIGGHEGVNRYRNFQILLNLLVFGSMLVGSIYFFIVFLTWRRERALLFFALLAFCVALRSVLIGSRIFYELDFSPNFEILFRLEVITFYISISSFIYFLKHTLTGLGNKWVEHGFGILAAVYSILTIILPIEKSTPLIYQYQVISVLAMIYIIIILFRSLLSKKSEGVLILTGFVFIAIAVYNDFLYVNTGNGLVDFELASVSIVLFLVPQAILLGIKLTRHSKMNFELSEDVLSINQSLSRFVPLNFVKILGKKDLREVELGNHSQIKATICFADIRDYTSISEGISALETLDFLNAYLSRIAPIVFKHKGEIDKFIGDSIMALFLNSPSDAVEAAIEMHQTLRLHNAEREAQNKAPMEIGIGLHYGDIVVGTVGHTERMNTTAISDAVNLASRIDGLCSVYRARILISDEVFRELDDPGKYFFRIVDQVKVKNRKASVTIFEILNAYSDEIQLLYQQTREIFERAQFAFANEQYAEAASLFQKITAINPNDMVAQRNYEKATRMLHLT